MPATAEPITALALSSKFTACDNTPLPSVELLAGFEMYEGDVTKVNVSLSEKGGAKRTRIRPVIKAVGTAAAVELADQVQEIAWAHCMNRGESGRYVAEMQIAEEGGGSREERVYFNLRPDTNEVTESNDTTDRPSLEYVHSLEQMVLTLSRQASSTAMRQQMNEGRRIDIAWAGIDRITAQEDARGRVALETKRLEGSERRKDKAFDGAIDHLLPKLLDNYLPDPKKKAEASPEDSNLVPIDRMRKLLTDEQFDGYKKALGEKTFDAFAKTKDLDAARELFNDLTRKTQKAILEAVGREHLITIANWE